MRPQKPLLFAKFGTESLLGAQQIDVERINGHAERLAPLKDKYDLALVSSGAVGWGEHRLRAQGKSPDGYDRRTLAMTGTAGITVAWEQAFDRLGIVAGQVLLTYKELTDPEEGANLQNAFEQSLRLGVVPVFNYKDFLSRPSDDHAELEKIDVYSDNDRFSLDVAVTLGASTLILATHGVEGLERTDGEIIEKVRLSEVSEAKKYIQEAEPASRGSFGMESKINHAASAAKLGMRAIICNANADFSQVLSNQQIHTEVIQ